MLQDSYALHDICKVIRQKEEAVRKSYNRDLALNSLENYLKHKINRLETSQQKALDVKSFLKTCHENLSWCRTNRV